jgi:hypothetical protein
LLVLGLPQAGSDQIARVLSGYALVFGIVVFLAALQFRATSRKHHASE